MEYKFFQLKLLIRLLIILITLFVMVLAFTGDQNYVTLVVFFLLLIVELFEMFRFIGRINREVEQFVVAVRNGDYSLNYNPERTGEVFRSLRNSLGLVMKDIQKARMEVEMQNIYLQMLIDHVDSGIMVFDEKMKIILQNTAASGFFPGNGGMNYLSENHRDLAEFIKMGKPGQKKLYETSIYDQRVQLAVRKTEFLLRDKVYQLISLQDIHSELDAKEIDSWYKLIRVLTHEIMNTVTPVNSLSGAMLEELKELKEMKSGNNLDDVILSAKTIFERSRDLMKFISDYKALTKTGLPEFENLDPEELVKGAGYLFEKEFKKEKIAFILDHQGKMSISADKEMIMRVLINLIRNAIEALKDTKEKQISIRLTESGGYKYIKVKDNGEGISEEYAGEIFVPFFTTRKKGSGIGLSLCRQIMHLHGGSVRVHSVPGKGSSFSLVFSK